MHELVLFSGRSNEAFAERLAARLSVPLGHCLLGCFANGETRVEIGQSVRERDVYIVQSGYGESTDATLTVNDHLMETLIMVQACRMASASRITVVLPCFPYGVELGQPLEKPFLPSTHELQTEMLDEFRHRVICQKQRVGMKEAGRPLLHCVADENRAPGQLVTLSRDPDLERAEYRLWTARSGRLVANLLQTAGATHIITMDLHHPQYQGFFDIPLDNLPVLPVLVEHLRRRPEELIDAVVVSPDVSGARRAVELASVLGLPFAVIHRERVEVEGSAVDDPIGPSNLATGSLQDPVGHNQAASSHDSSFCMTQTGRLVLVGNVAGRRVLLVDDLADSCGTLHQAAVYLTRWAGAQSVSALLTHGLFSPPALDRLATAPLERIVVTNTVHMKEAVLRDAHDRLGLRIEIADVSALFADTIRQIHNGESISHLFHV